MPASDKYNEEPNSTSAFKKGKIARNKKFDTLRAVKDSISIIAGIGCAIIGLKAFIIPNYLIDGGVTGISLLTKFTTGYPLHWLIFFINLPFILLSIKTVNKQFAINN